MGILKQQPLLSFSHLQFLFHRYFVLSYIIGKMHWKILFGGEKKKSTNS